MRDPVGKTFLLNPRRSSQRAAKTSALSALNSKSNSCTKRPADIETSNGNDEDKGKANPLREFQNKCSSERKPTQETTPKARRKNDSTSAPPKKRWKSQKQQLPVAEVTPNGINSEPSISPPMIESYRCSLKKDDRSIVSEEKNQKPNNQKSMRNYKEPLAEPVLLAKLELDGVFEIKGKPSSFEDTNGNGSDCDSNHVVACTRNLRSVRVMTYNQDTAPKYPFPVKLYHMVEWGTLESPQACRWSKDGKSIEIDAKNPALLVILQQHFKHSRWLSFSRQLNNYGFNTVKENQVNRNQKIKSYQHPKFHRGIGDPTVLTKLLPYLPGKRKREKKRNFLTLTKAKRPNQETEAMPPAPKRRSSVNTVTPSVKTQSTRIRQSEKLPSRGKDIASLVDFLKTPSPRYRSAKAKYMSSPPPLSHYLQAKHRSHRHPSNSQHQEQDSNNEPTFSSANESPLPSTLLTVNILMTPSPLSCDNSTPRIHNLSSTFVASSSHSSKTSRSPDGVRMLSWAARAVESPVFQKKKGHTYESKDTRDRNMESVGIAFAEAIGCSPIVRSNKASLAVAGAVHRNFPISANKNTADGCFPTPPQIAATYNDGAGPSPLCFREHHDSDVELELLRSCLEDVFVASGSTGNDTDGESIVPPHCTSVDLEDDGSLIF